MLVSNNEIIQQFYISGYYNRLCQSYFLRPQSHPQEAVVIFFSIILSQWIGLIRKKNLDGDLST